MSKKIKWNQIKELKWIGCDFDDVVCTNSGFPNYIPQKLIPGAVEALQKLDRMGYKIVIYTARPWSDYENLERLCQENKIPVRRIICGKPLFKWIIDDKNIEFNPSVPGESWDGVVAKISK